MKSKRRKTRNENEFVAENGIRVIGFSMLRCMLAPQEVAVSQIFVLLTGIMNQVNSFQLNIYIYIYIYIYN
jgi:hypothetical protein